jgi:hypothetical protein
MNLGVNAEISIGWENSTVEMTKQVLRAEISRIFVL